MFKLKRIQLNELRFSVDSLRSSLPFGIAILKLMEVEEKNQAQTWTQSKVDGPKRWWPTAFFFREQTNRKHFLGRSLGLPVAGVRAREELKWYYTECHLKFEVNYEKFSLNLSAKAAPDGEFRLQLTAPIIGKHHYFHLKNVKNMLNCIDNFHGTRTVQQLLNTW